MAAPATVKPEVRDLATRLYSELVGRSVLLSEGAVKMPVGAENLARLSFKLAEAFQAVLEELNAANLPKNQDFKVDAASIASWTK